MEQFSEKKKEREGQIKKIRKQGGVIITSYGMVSSESLNLSELKFDVVVVDEGHKAKNVNT